ncbi:siderophore biosynthesis protein [Prevotella sp. oral taxon 376]|uniref:4'-phosphopantetheinyl transferase superfamily protein n=1 Tax=Prevotella sp. oral taxon 376 TaxID=712466 RepID=UPI000D1FC5BA|nr:4'-phosphopantetheinyl transferase superfamily protein [Prevotella sp. oral taxon 376]PTL34465.1 siderophore biosynthesis protein [Prevotella sp. oral taxon 376]
MPLISIENLEEDVRLGLWKMEETPEEMLLRDASLKAVCDTASSCHSEVRKTERLCIHELLYQMTGLKGTVIDHDPSSKPLLRGFNLSISHTRGYAALILSPRRNVAVDIEYMSERVNRIAGKFIRDDEIAPDTVSRLVNWSAKETIYKLFSDEDLRYFEMRILPFLPENHGTLLVEDLKIAKQERVFYRINEEYVLSYSYQPLE